MTENPLDDRRCRATSKRSGERCKRIAIPGGTVCVMHGGAAPATRAAAEHRQAEAEADVIAEKLWAGLGVVPEVTNPGRSLQKLAGGLERMVDRLGGRVDDLEHLEAGKDLAQVRGVVVLFERMVGHLRALLVDMKRLGLAEEMVQLEQDKARMVAVALQEGMDAVGMSPEQREVFGEAYLRRLRIVDAGAVAGAVEA